MNDAFPVWMWPQLISLSALFRGPVRPWLHSVRSDRQSQRIARKCCWQTSSKLALICLYSSASERFVQWEKSATFCVSPLVQKHWMLSTQHELRGLWWVFLFCFVFLAVSKCFCMCPLLLILTMQWYFSSLSNCSRKQVGGNGCAFVKSSLQQVFSLCHIPSLRVRCPFCVEFATL